MRLLFNDAPTPVTGDVIGWADTIFVMERSHLTRLNKKCRAPTKGKRVVIPGVPDDSSTWILRWSICGNAA